MVSEPLAFVLRNGRDALNARFAAARRQYPALDGEAFRAFLETTVDPLAQATHAAAPDSLAEVVMAAYELGLELAGQRLVGSDARHPLIEQGWRALASTAVPLVARAPRLVLAAWCNALHQLATTPGARPGAWIDAMSALAPRCADPATFLKVGQVRGWLAGLAHYRQSALAVCDGLPEPLALAAVGAAGSWAAVRDRLNRDPWFVPGGDGPGAQLVGAFRGLGGLFRSPPRVALRAGQLVVNSAEDWWVLAADAFGATFHQALPEERSAEFTTGLPTGVQVTEGSVEVRGRALDVPVAGALTSVAADGVTLALTSSLSHAIVLLPLGVA
jgi:hypothetical protein